MQPFPHHYAATAESTSESDVELASRGLPRLRCASPAAFDGPGDRWSPETLLVGAVADCFILTFRAVARASSLAWTSLRCEATGTLDRVDRVTQFTAFDVRANLEVPFGTDSELGHRVLEKAERNCLISNSLKGPVRLTFTIVTAREHAVA